MLSNKKIVCPEKLLSLAKKKGPVRSVIVNAGKSVAIESAKQAVAANLIEPIFVGDKSIIEKIGGVVDKDGNISINYNPKQETSRNILKKAEEAGLEVNDFSVTGASLETVFLSMTSKK